MVRNGHMELFSHWADAADHGKGAYVYSFNTDGETVQNPHAPNNVGRLGLNTFADVVSYSLIRRTGLVGAGSTPMLRHVPGDADVNGDGRSDLIAQNGTDTWVMTSTGTSFTAPVRWSAVAFAGGVATHIGDVNGDGRSDLIAQNATDTWVMTSTGTSFTAPTRWSAVAFRGDVANHG
jgi:hypothetical protein